MRPAHLVLFAAALTLTCVWRASAQERLVLKGGRTVEGKVIAESETTLLVRTAQGVETVEKSNLVRREKAPEAKSAAPPASPLQRMKNPGAHDAKMDAFVAGRKKGSSPLPREARTYLKGLPPDRALDVVMTFYLEAGDDRNLRRSAVYHLKFCAGAARLAQAYETAAQDESAYIRGMAVKNLAALAASHPAESPVREKAEFLVRRSLRSQASWDQQRGVYAAAQIWGEAGIPELLRVARSGLVPKHAYRAVASIAGTAGVEALKSEYSARPLTRIDIKGALEKRLGKASAESFFKDVSASDALKGLAWRLGLPVSFELVTTPLEEAAQFLSGHCNVQVVLDPAVKNTGRVVTLYVPNHTVHEAIYGLCFTSGLNYRVERDIIRIVPGRVTPLRSNLPPSPKLSGRVSLEFEGTPASEALSFVQTMTRLRILLSPRARDRARKARVTLQVKGRPVGSVLRDLARRIGARMVVRGRVIEFH